MKLALVIDTPSGINPIARRNQPRSGAPPVLDAMKLLKQVVGGGLKGRKERRPTVRFSYGRATATIAPTAAAVADTASFNGTALTATQHRARCTVTLANVSVADEVEIGDGDDTVVFVAVAADADPAAGEFNQGGTDTQDAASLVTAINTIAADPESILYGLVSAKSAAGVVDIYAQTPGTAGNAFTIATSNGTRLAITNDDTGEFAGGAAIGNNEFDPMGTNAETCEALKDAINASTTGAVADHVKASNRSAVVTCASVEVGDYVTLDGIKLKAQAVATDSGGARIAGTPDDIWYQGGTDTADATSLVNCINAHPILSERFKASSSSGAVTVRELPPEATEAPKLTSNNGTRLAVTSAATGGFLQNNGTVLIAAVEGGTGGNAVTVASSNGTRLPIGGSAARLAGGTHVTLSF